MEKNLVKITMHDCPTKALIDTGADISCMSEKFFRSLPSKFKPSYDKPKFNFVSGVGGEKHPILGKVSLNFKIDEYEYNHDFHIFKHLHHHVIIGNDFLVPHKAIVNSGRSLQLENGRHVGLVGIEGRIGLVRSTKSIVIPAAAEMIVGVRISNADGKNVLLESTNSFKRSHNVFVAKTVSKVEKGKSVCRVINPTDVPVTINAGTVLATATTIHENMVFELSDSPSVNEVRVDHNQDQSNAMTKEEAIECAKKLGIELDNPALTEKNKQDLLECIGRYRDVFANDMSELGKTNVHTHHIDTGDAKPIRQRPYRTSPTIAKEIQSQTDTMLKNSIIEPSSSEWQSPVVMVKKKTGDYRFAVDYRKLNEVTRKIHYPIPRIDDVFDKLGDKQPTWFSTLDLASGFWQIPLDPNTKEKTAFVTNTGEQYQFRVLPFGMANAPATYQMVLNKVLQGLSWEILMCYIDDIIIFSNTFSEHLEHISMVLTRLREASLTLKPSKCKFAAQRVMYLGHYLSKNGIEVDPAKTNAVKSFPTPKNVRQIRSFLGMCSFYRRFIKGFSKIAAPLHELTAKDVPFKWEDKHENAFNVLKSALMSTPVLRYPDWSKPFILTTDASITAISFILGQKDETGKEYAIAFGGRGLRGAEKNYGISELECLAMVEGVRAFEPYLAHKHFTAITDNNALQWLKGIKPTNKRIARWSLRLQDFDFTVKHRAGVINKNADALSRREYDSTDSPLSRIESDCLDEITAMPINAFSKSQTIKSKREKGERLQTTFEYPGEKREVCAPSVAVVIPDNIAREQQNCPEFADVYRYLKRRELPRNARKARKIILESEQYILDDDVLYHLYTPRTRKIPDNERIIRQLAVPIQLRDDVLKSYHDSLFGGGHQGFDRTYASIRLKYYWPNMFATIIDYVKSCDDCQKAKRNHLNHPAPLQNMPIVGRFDRWHMDILGPFSKGTNGEKYLLSVIDSFSRWPELFAINSDDSQTIAKILYEEVFSRYGAPRVLVSDRGQNFMSKLVKAVSSLFQVTRHHTSSYHPQTNSTCERLNSTINQSIRAYCPTEQSNWPSKIPGILIAHRMTPATRSTSYSPYYMLFGTDMQMPLDTALKPQEKLPSETEKQLQYVKENLEIAHKIATERVEKAQEKSKNYFDKNAKEPRFKVGESVLLYTPKTPKGISSKHFRKNSGSYYIVEKGPNFTFKIADLKTNKEQRSLVSGTRLRPYYDDKDRRIQPTPNEVDQTNNMNGNERNETREENENQSDPEAECLLKTKVRNQTRFYLVKWKDKNMKNTWVPKENIGEGLIKEYHIKYTSRGTRRKKKLKQ